MVTQGLGAASVARRYAQLERRENSTMQANLVGFELHVGKTVSLAEFFDHLRSLGNQQIRFAGHERMIYIGERADYYLGLFITIKDQAKFCELRSDGDEFEISVRSLDDGTNIVDFNFFVVHKDTGRGLYLHYHQSCSANQFGLYCRRRYEDLRGTKKDADIAALGSTPTKKALRAIAAHYKKVTLKLVVMVRKEKLSELLEEFESIQVFEFDVQAMTSEEPEYTPVRPFIKRQTRRIRFIKQSSQSVIRSWISAVAGSVQRARVQGLDEDGETRAFRLMDNPDSFGSYEYETIADDAFLSLKNFESSPLFESMFTVIGEHKHLFEVPVE